MHTASALAFFNFRACFLLQDLVMPMTVLGGIDRIDDELRLMDSLLELFELLERMGRHRMWDSESEIYKQLVLMHRLWTSRGYVSLPGDGSGRPCPLSLPFLPLGARRKATC